MEQKDFILDGMNWCYFNTDQNRDILLAKYKKGQPVRVKARKSQPTEANVYADGNALIGFLGEYAFKWVLDQREQGHKVFGQIHKVEHINFFPEHLVIIRLQTSPFKKAQPRSSVKPVVSIERPVSISKPRKPGIKHPITNKTFRAQKALASVCRNLAGRTGVYCIYSKSFATYIGQSKDIGKRLRQHISDLKAGRHHNALLQADWNDNGPTYFAFHQIETCTEELLDEREHFYICAYKTYEYGYNATFDGKPPALEKLQLQNEETSIINFYEEEIFPSIGIKETEDKQIATAEKDNKSETNDAANHHGSVISIVETLKKESERKATTIHQPFPQQRHTPVTRPVYKPSHFESRKPSKTFIRENDELSGITLFPKRNTSQSHNTKTKRYDLKPELFKELETEIKALRIESRKLKFNFSTWTEKLLGRPSNSKRAFQTKLEKLTKRVELNRPHITEEQFSELISILCTLSSAQSTL